MFVWKSSKQNWLVCAAEKFSFHATLLGSSWKAPTTASLSSSPTLTLTQGHSGCQIVIWEEHGGRINGDMENIN